MWEVLWTQGGMPSGVLRWADEIRVRFTGAEVPAYRDYAWRTLRDATQAAGIALRDVSAEENAAEIANLEFQLLADSDFQPDMTGELICQTQPQRWRQFMLEKVVIKARARRIAFCGYHEVMHAMGLRGHPSGATVLRYFIGPQDAFLPMDLLMLKAWYSPRMKPGATAFEAVQVLTDAVIESTVEEPQREAARNAQSLFLRSRLAEMERFARGEGEVPAIVLRSGWANEKVIANGQTVMAYFVGVAHLRGIGTAADPRKALGWFQLASEKGSPAAKTRLEQLSREMQ